MRSQFHLFCVVFVLGFLGAYSGLVAAPLAGPTSPRAGAAIAPNPNVAKQNPVPASVSHTQELLFAIPDEYRWDSATHIWPSLKRSVAAEWLTEKAKGREFQFGPVVLTGGEIVAAADGTKRVSANCEFVSAFEGGFSANQISVLLDRAWTDKLLKGPTLVKSVRGKIQEVTLTGLQPGPLDGRVPVSGVTVSVKIVAAPDGLAIGDADLKSQQQWVEASQRQLQAVLEERNALLNQQSPSARVVTPSQTQELISQDVKQVTDAVALAELQKKLNSANTTYHRMVMNYRARQIQGPAPAVVRPVPASTPTTRPAQPAETQQAPSFFGQSEQGRSGQNVAVPQDRVENAYSGLFQLGAKFEPLPMGGESTTAVGLRSGLRAEDVTDEVVLEAIKRGVSYLMTQKKNDNFESRLRRRDTDTATQGDRGEVQAGGETALVVYALLNVWMSTDDPELGPDSKQLGPVIKWLRTVDPESTYCASLLASALAMTPRTPENTAALTRSHAFLIEAMGSGGGYTYTKKAKTATAKPAAAAERDRVAQIQERIRSLESAVASARKINDVDRINTLQAEIAKLQESLKPAGKTEKSDAPLIVAGPFAPFGDLSNGQFGLLGAWTVADLGYAVPRSYWETSDRFWRLTQDANGSWPYNPNRSATASGVDGASRTKDSMGVAGIASLLVAADFLNDPRRCNRAADEQFDRGMTWLEKTFNPRSRDLYYLYGVERIALASGQRTFGVLQWYREMAASVVNTQRADGSWTGGFLGSDGTVGTSFALLLLARGRNPIMFNKLQYDGEWNPYPRDLANLTNYLAKNKGMSCGWHVVDIKSDVRDWLEAPVLFVSGKKDPGFTPEDAAKLQQYVEMGGMIVAAPAGTGNPDAFLNGLRRVVKANSKGEARRLKPQDLPEVQLGNPGKAPVADLEMNGSRVSWVLSSADLGAMWQNVRSTDRLGEKPALDLGVNLVQYATSGGRGAPRAVRSQRKALQNGPAIAVLRLVPRPTYDLEPGGWRVFAETMLHNTGSRVDVVNGNWDQLDASKYPVVHVTRNGAITWPDDGVQMLRNYLDKGGLLFADANGGNPEFTLSVLELLKKAYPDGVANAVDEQHPLRKGSLPGSVKQPSLQTNRYQQLKNKRPDGRVEVFTVNGRAVAVLCYEDVTTSMLGHDYWGVCGLSPDTAISLARNVLVFSVNPEARRTK